MHLMDSTGGETWPSEVRRRTTKARSPTTDPTPFEPDFENERPDNHATIVPEPGFQQVTGILRRRIKPILTVAALGTILAGVAGLLITPKYTATAQVLVQAATPLSPEAVQQAVDTQLTMLTSPVHLHRVLDSLRKETGFRGATSEPEANSAANTQAPAVPSTGEAGPLSLKELKRRLDVWIGALTGHKRDGTGLTFDDLQRRLQVLQDRRSRVIDVSFEWTSPEKAAEIVNRTVELYVQNSIEQQRAYSTNEIARIEERISAVKGEIEQADAALQASQLQSGANRIVGSEAQEAAPDPHELERRAATSAQLYESLLQRQKEIREQDGLVNPDASILSLASPPSRPSSPNPILFVLPALIASLICASLLALTLERLDRGLRSECEINAALGLSCIGLIPRIPRRHLSDLGKYLRAKPFSPYASALWSVVATLRMAKPGNAKVVLISSSIPGEGKTRFAQSLATYISFLGRRVLLVGLDFRKGSRVGEFNDRRIVDLSLQNRPPAELIRHIEEAGFDYLPMPGYRLDPLTATEQMADLIRELRESYDYVIIDGPSVLGAVEARLLPSIADRLLLVVKWGSTRREVAQNALGLLRKSGGLNKEHGDLAMAIATQVNLKRHARYRYGDVGEFSSGTGRSR
ncbi:polysaccharide biosynthesis tyrosine autokinase [Mesorhizobium sp. ES1-4]|uniref:polysaccharide biosynthesis tyrosine autokinase n=1 Tax=Mesorhizobium sp. ES1-4 TaxID=2876627 RepID=UPI001CCFFBE3|nr:polysaccharide biosynthesis tyrosine autokinase [Mesorhizobium sp. ES1-4]MBZ9800091.1 lipopolysaccharide biosynthesis protein [Mesorhizobium sp. ES1-4]